jgi:hypothetical protein
MAHIREQLEAYREDVVRRLQALSEKLRQQEETDVKLQERLENVIDALEATVDVFLRHDSAMEMQLRVARLWIFLSYLMAGDRTKTGLVLKFIESTKSALNAHLNDLWKAPLPEVVPIRNRFREELKVLVKSSSLFQ